MLCVAITTADQWFWSFIVSRTTPYVSQSSALFMATTSTNDLSQMITSLGYGTYFFFASLMVAMGFW
jgi:hypothetical protein